VGIQTFNIILMLAIFGMCVAAVVGGYRKYMFYRSDGSTTVAGNTIPNYRLWIGWYQYTASNLENGSSYLKLRNVSLATYILGIISAGMMGLSAILALLFALFTCCGYNKSLACLGLPFGFVLFGSLVAFYIDACIEFRSLTGRIPWPVWAWCLGIASSLLWMLASGLWLGTPSRTKLVAVPGKYDAERPPPRSHHIPEHAKLGATQATGVTATARPLPDTNHAAGATAIAAPIGATLGAVQPKTDVAPEDEKVPTRFGRFRKVSGAIKDKTPPASPSAAAAAHQPSAPFVNNQAYAGAPPQAGSNAGGWGQNNTVGAIPPPFHVDQPSAPFAPSYAPGSINTGAANRTPVVTRVGTPTGTPNAGRGAWAARKTFN
jgi:hypothetical protein